MEASGASENLIAQVLQEEEEQSLPSISEDEEKPFDSPRFVRTQEEDDMIKLLEKKHEEEEAEKNEAARQRMLARQRITMNKEHCLIPINQPRV